MVIFCHYVVVICGNIIWRHQNHVFYEWHLDSPINEHSLIGLSTVNVEHVILMTLDYSLRMHISYFRDAGLYHASIPGVISGDIFSICINHFFGYLRKEFTLHPQISWQSGYQTRDTRGVYVSSGHKQLFTIYALIFGTVFWLSYLITCFFILVFSCWIDHGLIWISFCTSLHLYCCAYFIYIVGWCYQPYWQLTLLFGHCAIIWFKAYIQKLYVHVILQFNHFLILGWAICTLT